MVVSNTAKYWLTFAFALLLLSGCARHVSAPVSSRDVVGPDRIDTHIVSTGETLYSIAWRFGLEHRKLAAANGIGKPYTIYVGQRLNLDTSKRKSISVSRHVATKPGAQSATRPADKSTVSKAPTAKPAPVKPIAKPRVAKVTPPPSSKLPQLPEKWRWRWPVNGKMIRHYDTDKRFKGVFINAKNGTAVKAAGPGVVVYAGSGLHSYGPSIIIKHNDLYLSFYALNRKLLVKEGDQVSDKQKIAEVGGDVNNRNRIYFEIRRDGKSTDPIRLLPKR